MKTLYDTIKDLAVEGLRTGHKVSITGKSIAVTTFSLYSDEQVTVRYYKEYPSLPGNWDEIINWQGTTAAEKWLHDLKEYKPYRTVKD